MNALELAEECQDGYPLAPDAIAAASMLRRQYSDLAIAHEAIVKLREALRNVTNAQWLEDTYDTALKALKDTEDLK